MWRWAICGADGRVRPLDLVVDRLADVVEQAAHLGDLDVRADLGRDDRGQMARLDDVVEHVLAVAGPELQAPQELDDLRGQARDARLVGGLLAGLAHHELDLGARLVDDLLDATGVDPAVGDELGDRETGHFPADGVEPGEHDRLGGVVDDQVHARGLLERPDVATLAADDPALHLVRGQVDDADRVLGRVIGRDALHRGHDDVAGLVLGILARGALDGPGELDRVVLGLFADGLEERALRVVRGHPGHALERLDLLLVGGGQVLAGLVELALAVEELAIALLEHVGALVELLVAGEQAALERRELVALGPRLVLGLALHPELLVLRLEDELLLAGAGLGLDAPGLGLGRLHRLRGPQAAQQHAEYGSADGGHEDRRHDDRCLHQ